ncbi:MAG TPA: hypothetical protein VF616_32220 [Duganella sp.]|jgi:hypothetical protein|uniref:hypothetical protein n=1 Tax=Duganella sp. TaxID=1904440 RepID=UPI002ED65623
MAYSKDVYVSRSYDNAFGDRGEDWSPELGFGANRARMIKLYDYYQDVYNKSPGVLLWAGLGRMAGAEVVAGLDYLASTEGDIGPIQNELVSTAKAIFDDLAWLHEAWIDDPEGAVDLARDHDAQRPGQRSYAEALMAFNTGDADQIVAGNKILLEIEQFSVVQPHYDVLGNAFTFGLTRTAAENVHPYHRGFLESFPTTVTKDVTVAADRWEWINLPGGMWEKWASPSPAGMDGAERSRLVNLAFDQLLRRDFAVPDGLQFLLPPGAP